MGDGVTQPGVMPPIELFHAALGRGGAGAYSTRGTSSWTLPRTGRPATLAVWQNWRSFSSGAEAGQAHFKAVSETTALRVPLPELLGIVGRFAVRLKEDGGVKAGMSQDRDKPLVLDLLNRGLGAAIQRGPLSTDTDPDLGVKLRYDVGQLVLDTAGGQSGDAVAAHMQEIAEASVEIILAWLAETSPVREPLDAHVGTDKPREIGPGAADLQDARRLLMEKAPKRFMRGPEPPTDEEVWGGFAKSYADARGMKAEFAPWAKEELPRFGNAYAEAKVSVVGRLADGRPIRVARVMRPTWHQPEGQGFQRVLVEPRDIAMVELSGSEIATLSPHLPQPGARLAGPYLIAEAVGEREQVTATGLDAVRQEAERLVALAPAERA